MFSGRSAHVGVSKTLAARPLGLADMLENPGMSPVRVQIRLSHSAEHQWDAIILTGWVLVEGGPASSQCPRGRTMAKSAH